MKHYLNLFILLYLSLYFSAAAQPEDKTPTLLLALNLLLEDECLEHIEYGDTKTVSFDPTCANNSDFVSEKSYIKNYAFTVRDDSFKLTLRQTNNNVSINFTEIADCLTQTPENDHSQQTATNASTENSQSIYVYCLNLNRQRFQVLGNALDNTAEITLEPYDYQPDDPCVQTVTTNESPILAFTDACPASAIDSASDYDYAQVVIFQAPEPPTSFYSLNMAHMFFDETFPGNYTIDGNHQEFWQNFRIVLPERSICGRNQAEDMVIPQLPSIAGNTKGQRGFQILGPGDLDNEWIAALNCAWADEMRIVFFSNFTQMKMRVTLDEPHYWQPVGYNTD